MIILIGAGAITFFPIPQGSIPLILVQEITDDTQQSVPRLIDRNALLSISRVLEVPSDEPINQTWQSAEIKEERKSFSQAFGSNQDRPTIFWEPGGT